MVEQGATGKIQHKEVYRRWKWNQVTGEECRHHQACRDGVRKAKVQLELKMESLASDIKVKKIDFFKYIGDKRMAEINMGPLLNEAGNTGCGKG